VARALGDGRPEGLAVSARRGVVALAVGLAFAGCAPPAAQVTAPEPPPAAPPVAAVTAAPEPPRQVDQIERIARELVELQNAVARLMMSARQHDDHLVYLQRRLGDLEAQARSRTGAPPAFAPSAAVPAPLPPPPTAAAAPAPAPSPLPRAARATTTPAVPAPPPTPAATSAGEMLYQSGRAKFEAGDFDAAVVTLYQVVATFPKEPAREHAQLLVGEIFLAQKDYRGAVAEFEGLLAAVPGGSRVPDTLLKLGVALRALGDEGRARRAWERLVKEHPNSAAARQARTLLRGGRG
jgi:tol-pal system protein YbgF